MDLGHPRQQRQGGFKALLLLAVLSIHATVAWAAGPVFVFDIPAGDAQKTLQQFYSQSKIELLYLADSVRGTHTNSVSGQLDASTALEAMLRGTSLEYTFEEDFSFVSIRPRVVEAGTADPRGRGEVDLASVSSAERDASELAARVFGANADLEQVVITGTLIPGVFDIISPLEFVTRREMRQSAYGTVQDALDMLPVNMGGGPSEDFSSIGNFGRGSGVNLRGLGSGATLVLVNGRRQPYSERKRTSSTSPASLERGRSHRSAAGRRVGAVRVGRDRGRRERHHAHGSRRRRDADALRQRAGRSGRAAVRAALRHPVGQRERSVLVSVLRPKRAGCVGSRLHGQRRQDESRRHGSSK